MNGIKAWIIPLLLFLGCGVHEKDPQKTIVLLFDLSASTSREETVKNYLHGVQIILPKVNHGDVVAGGSILESSFSEEVLPINEEIPLFIPSKDNFFVIKKERIGPDEKLKKTREDIYATAEKLLSRHHLKGRVLQTDILSSLHVAERIFKTYKNERKILVIFSDMIQDSSEYNFEKEILSKERIEEIISEEKSMNRMPELTSVMVYIAGATAPTTEKFFARRNFWLTYFKECGAAFLQENYGTTLIKF